ncbi:MAG: F0F1 ATP synthase subunit delta [Alphaproteobacteria bacterium]|nr:F0F1 ATP synthase subunit delta [Alphaproteobacteria bacterium]MBU6473508.1 F0F1 ATP synthase subunit delta [Alphaproteobacteria bacterium]MDE2013082.1 F0F1 ATP synthase subunit delta [Alphaproteobacteria bacterium]MDE2074698.1 F0F1 ATP synthase subunit delta [Alphaproteobacteria bacterium]
MATEEPLNAGQNTGLAGRYASAVFELAVETKAVETVEKDLAALKAMIAQSADLARLVRAPVFSRDEQKKGMDAILNRMEAAPLTRRFVLTLASKRRLFALADVIRAFEALVARRRGEVTAEVTSARPLTDAETTELKNVLKARLGREARLDARVDPGLLGGLVVRVGSRMIDSSLRTKLNGLRTAMRGA